MAPGYRCTMAVCDHSIPGAIVNATASVWEGGEMPTRRVLQLRYSHWSCFLEIVAALRKKQRRMMQFSQHGPLSRVPLSMPHEANRNWQNLQPAGQVSSRFFLMPFLKGPPSLLACLGRKDALPKPPPTWGNWNEGRYLVAWAYTKNSKLFSLLQ